MHPSGADSGDGHQTGVPPSGHAWQIVRTLDLAAWAGRWIAVDTADRMRCDASSLAEVLEALAGTDVGDVEVMRGPAADEPVFYGLC